jgi:hypothetical protein
MMAERVDAALDRLAAAVGAFQDRIKWAQSWWAPLTAAGLVLTAVIALFRMESSGPDYDPQYMRVLVERTMRFGGSYYENGIHNKGPFEPLVYEIAAHLGGHDGFWFVIGAFALVAALCIAAAATVVTVWSGGSRLVGVSVAAAAVAHFTLSRADYAGVLYARNMTVALLSVAFVVGASDRCWATPARRVGAVVAVGATTGLAVQTLLTTAFTASVVLLWAMWHRRSSRVMGQPAWLVMAGASAFSFATAPVCYRFFGPWRDFVDGWWVYARFMSTGTGRSAGAQASLGWDQLFEYYRERPELVVIIQLWIVITALGWHRLDGRQRSLRVLIGAWFVCAWIEMILSQRYSSHYFSIIAVPTLLMVATLLGELGGRVTTFLEERPSSAVLPLAAALLVVQIGGQAPFDAGIETAGVVVRTEQFTTRRSAGVDGRTAVLRATMDLVSERNDPVLMWTSYPWPYLNFERVSATRYIWKSFLLGEIYLGQTSEDYVLDGTWEHFADDLAASDPTAFYVEAVTPVAAGTPFEAAVEERFTTVFQDDVATLALRNDLVEWFRSSPVDPAPVVDTGGGVVELAADRCVRLDAALRTDGVEPLRIEFGGVGNPPAVIMFSPGEGSLLVESHRRGDASWLQRLDTTGESTTIRLFVGARAAVAVIDGSVVGAVRVEPNMAVTVTSGLTSIDGAVVSDPGPTSGC